ncbi:MAG: DUF2721 domain-containing protein [Candidatus Moranbacteria bacterium]|nr:DUF2721 domain-containing protein [Candidatus Moranbacteria bacterium]
MLAPAVMISACGLLILGTNNKYTSVINRIRILSQERRSLGVASDSDGMERLASIDRQLDEFRRRVVLVRNSVLSYSVAVGLFTTSSLVIGLLSVFSGSSVRYVAIAAFLSGMLLVLSGVSFAARETWEGYRIVRIEIDGAK